MFMKILIVVFLIVILYCLGSGVYYLSKAGRANEINLAKSLTWRIGLSILLFLFIIFSYFMGWLHPHDLYVTPPGVK